jgi:hypothetical protein
MEGSKNPETSALYAQRSGCRSVNTTGMGLPSQHQPPGLDSTIEIGIPRGAKFYVLSPLVVRKNPLYAFIKLL